MANTSSTAALPATPSALDAFMQAHAHMGLLLERLNAAHEEFLSVHPEECNWGHVGSAGKACEDLEELIKFLNV